MRIPARYFILSLIPLLVSCRQDATGPSVNLSGDWSYLVTDLRGFVTEPQENVCRIEGLTVHLTQTGNVLTGSTSGGEVKCSVPEMDSSALIDLGPVAPMTSVHGTVDSGGQIRLTFDPGGTWLNTGTVRRAGGMNGQVRITGYSFDGSTSTATGSFSMGRY